MISIDLEGDFPPLPINIFSLIICILPDIHVYKVTITLLINQQITGIPHYKTLKNM